MIDVYRMIRRIQLEIFELESSLPDLDQKQKQGDWKSVLELIKKIKRPEGALSNINSQVSHLETLVLAYDANNKKVSIKQREAKRIESVVSPKSKETKSKLPIKREDLSEETKVRVRELKNKKTQFESEDSELSRREVFKLKNRIFELEHRLEGRIEIDVDSLDSGYPSNGINFESRKGKPSFILIPSGAEIRDIDGKRVFNINLRENMRVHFNIELGYRPSNIVIQREVLSSVR